MLEAFQGIPLVGAVISAGMALGFYFLNGYREKKEGRQEAEREHMQEAIVQDSEIRERSDHVEETIDRVRDRHDRDGLRDASELADHHFRD